VYKNGKDGKDGLDGKDGISVNKDEVISEILENIKLPEYELFNLEEKGEQIVTEINALPLEDEYKIDASHIKNLPKSKASTAGPHYLPGDNITIEGNVISATGGGSALTVQDIDGNPTATNVNTIKFTNGSVTDDGAGVVTVTTGSGGGGDVSSNTATSVDSEVVLFSGTGGKTIKRATGTGVAHLTSGVLSASNIVTADITDANVTLAKMADVATGTVFYRKTASTGVPEVQTLATLKTDLGLTGTNSGDQTSIVGITGTKAQFNTAVSDGDILYVGDITQYTDEMAQDAVGGMAGNSTFVNLTYTDGTPSLTPSLSATGTPSSSTYLRGDNTWATVTGSGDVSKVGTPVNNQVGVWTGDGTIEGDAALTFDTTTDTLGGMSIINGAATGLTISTATNGNITLDPGGSGVTTVNAGSGGVAITTDAGNSNITLTPHGSGINVLANAQVTALTASRVVVTDGSKNLASSSVTSTELGYVSGVTSAIQTQLDAKAPIASPTFTGVATFPNTGLHLLDTNASHDLIIAPGSNLTADRTLTVTTGDTNMILDLTAVTDEYVLAYDSGTNTWRGVVASGGGGGSSVFSDLTDATGTNTIDNTNYAQQWNWSTLTTQKGLTLTGDALTTGTIQEITSTSTAATTAATYSGSYKALGINLTGANSTSSAVTYGLYVLNAKTGTTSQNYAIHADTTNAGGLITNIPIMWTAYDGGGAKLGSRSSTEAAIWFKSVTPSTTNYTLGFDTNTLYVNSAIKIRSGASNQAGITNGGIWFDSAGGNAATGGQRFIARYDPTASANYGEISLGAQGNWNAGGTTPFAGSSSGTGIAINYASSFAGDLANWQLAGTSKFKVGANGAISVATIADASAPNSSLYFSSTASKLVWKDAGGTVNNLY
jgi:hypothetical protein